MVELKEIQTKKENINIFGGINDTNMIPQGSFKNMKNMYSDEYPLLSSRNKRKIYEGTSSINGAITINNNLYICAGTNLYKNGTVVSEVTLANNKKTLIAYGAYLIIQPDNILYNTKKSRKEDKMLNLDETYTYGVTMYASDEDGNKYMAINDFTHDYLDAKKITFYENDLFITNYLINKDIEVPFQDLTKKTYTVGGEDKSVYLRNLNIISSSVILVKFEESSPQTNYDMFFAYKEGANIKIKKWNQSTSSFADVDKYITIRLKSNTRQDNLINNIKEGDYIKLKACDSDDKVYTYKKTKENNKPIGYWNIIKNIGEKVKVEKVLTNTMSDGTYEFGIVIKANNINIIKALYHTDSFMKMVQTSTRTKSGGSTEVALVNAVEKMEKSLFICASNDNVPVNKKLCEKLHIMKEMPKIDYICVADNRIWGCSSDNHEIYACKQGDPTSWYTYDGIASDSYAVTIGSENDFTGAATLKGEPYFFKENLIIRMYGNRPSNYQVGNIYALGVESGSDKSIVELNGHLFYKSPNGIVAFNGSNVSKISDELGNHIFKNVIAGADFKKYFAIINVDGTNKLYVYDTEKKIWNIEDSISPTNIFRYKNSVFAVKDKSVTRLYGNDTLIQGTFFTKVTDESTIEWSAETGHIEHLSIEHKYIQKIGIRFETEIGAEIRIKVAYDNEDTWKEVYVKNGVKKEGSNMIILRPRRCEKFRLKFEGKGKTKIHAIQYEVNEGSDLNYGNV